MKLNITQKVADNLLCAFASLRAVRICKLLSVCIIILLTTLTTSAQDSLKVSILSNVKENVIQLRWAVNSPMAWKQTNQYGFRVERFTVVRHNVILEQPEKAILAQVLRPAPLDHWKDLATSNNYAAIIAQALYGADFKLTGDDAQGISKFLALAQEQEQRYLFSMYAADLCFPAAVLAGWGFEDKTAKAGERYLYRITSLVPAGKLMIQQGSVYVSLKEDNTLPQPQELTAVFGDKSVMLTWNYGILKKYYNAYHIEKSSDGKSFKRLSDIPFTNLNTQDGKPADRMYHIDTLANNLSEVYYRIIGVNAFGEESPPSEIVKGQGKNKLIYVPHITKAVPNATGGFDVSWEFDKRGNNLVKHFELQRSNTDRGPFQTVVKEIASDKREVACDNLLASNYFVITAIPHDGDPVSSFPVLVQPLDTIPPAAPMGLTGAVDTLGVVRLQWTANTEKDLLGYRIYRAQTKDEELVPLTDVAVRSNQFIDTLNILNLNSKVYYAVTALDQRYNQSAPSVKTELQKPDVVRPSPPLISNYKVTDQGIVLEWITGGEESIAALNLYRKESGSDANKLINTFNDKTIRTYTDKTTEGGRYYEYTLICVTASGLSSAPSPLVKVRASAKVNEAIGISSFTAKRDRKKKGIVLTWEHALSDVKQFELYKGEVGGNVYLWKIVQGYEKGIVDVEVGVDRDYEYLIRPVFESGRNGQTITAQARN